MTERKLLETILAKIESMDERFGTIGRRLEDMDKRFETIERRLEDMDRRFETIGSRLGDMDQRFETFDKRFDTMDMRVGQVVHHVAEVWQTNVRIEAGMGQLQNDVQTPDKKPEQKTDFLADKIDHFVEHFSVEHGRDRARLEKERHLRLYAQKETKKRLDAIEYRLDRLETASS